MNYFYIFLSAIIAVNTLISVITVFSDRNRDIAAIWAWLLVLNIFPVIGLIIYLFLGRKISKEDIYNLREQSKVGLPKYLEIQNNIKIDQLEYIEKKDFNDPKNKKFEMAKMLMRIEQPPISLDNEVEYFVDGREKFDQLIADIKKAEHHVHVSYYIFKGDKIGKRVVAALEEVAKKGVEVRVQYDPVGGRTLKKSLFQQLESYGGETDTSFGSKFHLLNIRLNYRNHRKIVVIDGKIGYVGGFNVGDDYLGEYENMGYWRDTHLRIEGTAVHQLQERFIIDWNASKKAELIAYEPYYFPVVESRGDTKIQIVSSGPDSELQQIKTGFLKMINLAKESIYIQTPYFIPDDALKETIELAVLSGVTVRLMIPNKPDHPFIYQATLSYAEELMNIGGEVYIYDKGFMHAKTIVIDDEITSVGTANFDIRSFKLNFEVNAFLYNKKTALEQVEYFEKDMKDSYLLTEEIIEAYSLWDRFKQQFSRLLSPIL
ncbi:cardiolipin synthetase 2 [Atopostipes suicloacalis DSM 15692]|uniref:Cardiolipin synthase n=1 Tax=Atopostipes suicloacalis DSM 15692 TaxID=1121025 RepID=A0A1M4VW58_9LACT|nr:cardiolipin synthase [Atopostipes suicloacalis]SHE73135.1 cardiolipin synthetase 2 [Atopostipes suicloacalis DSM 15692]